jgi:hypothetical protein
MDTSPTWLAGTPWSFVDAGMPYRSVAATLDARTPAVVEFDVDFSALGLPAGHDHVCIAAFITAPGDTIAAMTETSLDVITMRDKHVAHRNLHLVAAAAMPSPPPANGGHAGEEPETEAVVVPVEAHNPHDKPITVDVDFEHESFVGRLGVVVPRVDRIEERLHGFEVEEADLRYGRHWQKHVELIKGQPAASKRAVAHRVVERIARLDAGLVLRATDVQRPSLRQLQLQPGERLPLALVLQPPEKAKPGERFPITVVQRRDGEVMGGCTFVLTTYEATVNTGSKQGES